MIELDWNGMAVFFGALLIVLAGLWWMLRVNARDLERLEREMKPYESCGPSKKADET